MIKLFKKYQTFIKYFGVAIFSFLIDVGFFMLFNTLIKINELPATILARCISSPINFILNRNQVFVSNVKISKSIGKYFSLVIVQMFISGIVVEELCNFVSFNAVFIKIPVEIILFIMNYLIQKFLIFKK